MVNSSSSKYKNFLFYWLPIVFYCLLIFIQSSYPSPDELPDLHYLDKLLHFIGYAFLSVLFFRAFGTLRIQNNLKLTIILSILSASLYGIGDEIHQHYVPFRNADVMDGLVDIVGSVFGVFVYQISAVKYRA